MLSRDLEVTLNLAFKDAKAKRHELMSVEHLLLALLDNMRDEVLPVNRTGLGYVKMQSESNSAQWVRITGSTSRLAQAN